MLVYGDGDSDLDPFIRDRNGNLVCQDDGAGDVALFCGRTPRRTGPFTIRIVDCGAAHHDKLSARAMASRLIRLIAAAALAAASAAAQAEMRALVVGVTEYPTLTRRYQLEGPKNDVARLRELLLRRGFAPQHIAVLADGVPEATGLPTRVLILAGLDRLAKEAKRGDFVLLYFAGHGSQQPADRNTPEGREEADGLHEIFLPRDVGKWGEGGAAGSQTVHNAIVDHELRAAVDRITAAGAFVWGIFDACHSATLVRGGGETEGARFRYVDPTALGITAQEIADAGVRTRGAPQAEAPITAATAASGGGRSVFFYAAQTTELAPEYNLPVTVPSTQRRPYGLFGFVLAQALESGAPMTYRQLGQYVLTQYGARNERVTPLFSGTALDTPVLMQAGAAPVQQWPLKESSGKWTVPAGALNRLGEGALLAVLPGALSKDSEAVGYVKVTELNLTSSIVVAVAHAGKPALAKLPEGAQVRLAQAAAEYRLRVAVVPAPKTAAGALAQQAIYRLKREGVPGAQVEWLPTREGADLALRVDGERLLLLPPLAGTRGDVNPKDVASVPLRAGADAGNAALAHELAAALHGVARATNLMRIAADLSDPARARERLDVRIEIRSGGKTRPYAAGSVPVLRAGDKLLVNLRNLGNKSLDVTLLYADARFGVAALYPGRGESNRLEPGALAHEIEIDIDDSTTGIERLMTIAVEAEKHEERADFSFLQQPPLEQDGRTRGGPEPDAIQAFRDAGFAEHATRGGSRAPAAPTARTSMQVFAVRVTK